jgi:regulator of replication initiation timing
MACQPFEVARPVLEEGVIPDYKLIIRNMQVKIENLHKALSELKVHLQKLKKKKSRLTISSGELKSHTSSAMKAKGSEKDLIFQLLKTFFHQTK